MGVQPWLSLAPDLQPWTGQKINGRVQWRATGLHAVAAVRGNALWKCALRHTLLVLASTKRCVRLQQGGCTLTDDSTSQHSDAGYTRLNALRPQVDKSRCCVGHLMLTAWQAQPHIQDCKGVDASSHPQNGSAPHMLHLSRSINASALQRQTLLSKHATACQGQSTVCVPATGLDLRERPTMPQGHSGANNRYCYYQIASYCGTCRLHGTALVLCTAWTLTPR
jgi:hypothetical protein